MKQNEQFLKAGFPAIPSDKYPPDKFPHAGMIIRCYRERMIYTDHNGLQRHWTQQDLANALGVTEHTVRLIETQCKGLDSMKRCQFVADLLNIPPCPFGAEYA